MGDLPKSIRDGVAPCPFCGGKETRVQQNGRKPDGTWAWWEATCDDCDLVVQFGEDEPAKVIAAWNKRP